MLTRPHSLVTLLYVFICICIKAKSNDIFIRTRHIILSIILLFGFGLWMLTYGTCCILYIVAKDICIIIFLVYWTNIQDCQWQRMLSGHYQTCVEAKTPQRTLKLLHQASFINRYSLNYQVTLPRVKKSDAIIILC